MNIMHIWADGVKLGSPFFYLTVKLAYETTTANHFSPSSAGNSSRIPLFIARCATHERSARPSVPHLLFHTGDRVGRDMAALVARFGVWVRLPRLQLFPVAVSLGAGTVAQSWAAVVHGVSGAYGFAVMANGRFLLSPRCKNIQKPSRRLDSRPHLHLQPLSALRRACARLWP